MQDAFILFRNDFKGENLLFAGARSIVTAWSADEVEPAFEVLEQARADGLWAAGYVSYEAGITLEPALRSRLSERPGPKKHCPLMSFGIFDGPQPPQAANELLGPTASNAGLTGARPHWDYPTYRDRFDRLRRHLHAGDCFQANLTFEIAACHEDNPVALFNALRARQAVAHSALVSLDGPQIVSRSPELFFRIGRDGWIESKPMKGTAPRGTTPGRRPGAETAARA